MKLLWLSVAPLDTPGYRSTQFGMAIALNKIGWDIHFLGKSNKTKLFEGYPGFHGTVTLIPRKGKFLTEIKFHVTFWKILYKEYFDFVIFEPTKLLLILFPAILSRLKIIKTLFILDVRTPLVEEAIGSKIMQFNYWLAMRFAKWFLPAITVITEGLKKDLNPLLGKEKPVGIWGSGVDEELFNPANVIPVARAEFGFEDKFIFFYHGSLSLKRGLPELIKAMGKLHSEYPETVLVLLGNSADKNRLHEITTELKLENVVFFLDNVSNIDVPKYIAMADAGVIPLPDEHWWQVSSPLKLFEYMAMQLPIVVSDIEAHKSVLGDLPFVIYARDITLQDLYEALKNAITKISYLKKNVYLAREQIISKHSWAKRAETLSEFLMNIRLNN